jgi:hypothetical protein
MKILRKIYRPYRQTDYKWRIGRNDELYHIIGNINIISFIRSQRLRWFEHVLRTDNERLVRKMYKWKPLGKRMAGRPKNRWDDDVLKDLQLLKIKNWTKSIQNRVEWRKTVEKVKTFKERSCSTEKHKKNKNKQIFFFNSSKLARTTII